MFIGHYSAALVAAVHPKAPRLGTLFIGAQMIDIAFFSFTLVGVENMRIVPGMTAMNGMDLYDMPLTHSLLGCLVWALGFTLILRAMSREWTAPLIGGAVVFSHWLLDLPVHGPDLTLAGAAPKFGFGLWNHPMIEMPLEIILFLGTAWFFATHRRTDRNALLLLVGVMLALQAYNWFVPEPAAFGPMIPISGLFGYGLAAWLAYRVERPSNERIAR